MSFGPLRTRVLATVLGLTLVTCGSAALGQTNGIFADFTTSMGDFTCQLDYTNAPKTVANFIGLATGERAWLNLTNGVGRTDPFYDGLIFHRVITNFVIQAGSPDGTGTDGPGFVFMDEIVRTLNFNKSGVLAMANSGTNSNGSQFFINVAPTTSLNYRYTIFGRLVSGSNVVYAISRVPVDVRDKPLTNVVIQHVGIRRVGSAAQAFDIHKQALPVVLNPPLSAAPSGTNLLSLTFSNRPYADNHIYYTTDLRTWTTDNLGVEVGGTLTNTIYRAVVGTNRFYSLAQIQYPSSTFAPKKAFGCKLVLKISGDTLTINFDNSGGGTFKDAAAGSSGTVLLYFYNQAIYQATIDYIGFSGTSVHALQSLTLNFASATNGTFSVYAGGYLTGTFTWTPAP